MKDIKYFNSASIEVYPSANRSKELSALLATEENLTCVRPSSMANNTYIASNLTDDNVYLVMFGYLFKFGKSTFNTLFSGVAFESGDSIYAHIHKEELQSQVGFKSDILCRINTDSNFAQTYSRGNLDVIPTGGATHQFQGLAFEIFGSSETQPKDMNGNIYLKLCVGNTNFLPNTTFNVSTKDISDASNTDNPRGITTAKIENSAVTTDKIADSNITTVKIADGNVTTAKILDSNVTTAKINDSAVTTTKIADSNITTVKIADSNITTAKILDRNVTADKLGDNSVITRTVMDSQITGVKLGDVIGTGTATANGMTVTLSQTDSKGDVSIGISGDFVTKANQLKENRTFALTGDITGTQQSDLSGGVSIATSIAPNIIVASDLGSVLHGTDYTSTNNGITVALKQTESKNGLGVTVSCTPDSIKAGQFNTAKTITFSGDSTSTVTTDFSGATTFPLTISNSAITTAKISDSAVTEGKIGNSAVTTDKINNSAITTAKINDSAVTTAKLGSKSVTRPKIDDSAVSYNKLASILKYNGEIIDLVDVMFVQSTDVGGFYPSVNFKETNDGYIAQTSWDTYYRWGYCNESDTACGDVLKFKEQDNYNCVYASTQYSNWMVSRSNNLYIPKYVCIVTLDSSGNITEFGDLIKVTGIGKQGFQNGVDSIANLYLPNSIAYIGKSAFGTTTGSIFKDNTNIMFIGEPDGKLTIEDDAFRGSNTVNFYRLNSTAENTTVPFTEGSNWKVIYPFYSDGNISGSIISNDTITSDKLASVNGSKLVNGTVNDSKISSVATTKLTGTIATNQIGDRTVTSNKLAIHSVTSEKIGTSAVTSDKIAVGSVGTDKIANNSITTDKLGSNTIAPISRAIVVYKGASEVGNYTLAIDNPTTLGNSITFYTY